MTGGRLPAYGAAALAGAYAAVSAYWALGGTALLDTVGGSPERVGRAGGTAAAALGATSVVLKLAGVLLALALVQRWGRRFPPRLLRGTALVAGTVLALYGAAQVGLGAVALTGVLGPPADPTALRWHVLLWDPWFLLWGLCLLLAARRRRRPVGGWV